ncbi:MAG: DinB family protein [Polyangiaceae bacterium]|nr:DinB family protein [Polyangiaceae bacterium]
MQNFWPAVIGRQFAAAIQTMRAAIEACPDELWDDRTEGSPFWHLAYHALYFTDFYLSAEERVFAARDYHRDKAHFLPGDYREFGGIVTTPEFAYRKDQLLDYADHCLRRCDETFGNLSDERALERCGFWWYELNVGEFLINNLRHAQHHAGQLALLLRRRADVGIAWLGTRDNRPPPPTW